MSSLTLISTIFIKLIINRNLILIQDEDGLTIEATYNSSSESPSTHLIDYVYTECLPNNKCDSNLKALKSPLTINILSSQYLNGQIIELVDSVLVDAEDEIITDDNEYDSLDQCKMTDDKKTICKCQIKEDTFKYEKKCIRSINGNIYDVYQVNHYGYYTSIQLQYSLDYEIGFNDNQIQKYGYKNRWEFKESEIENQEYDISEFYLLIPKDSKTLWTDLYQDYNKSIKSIPKAKLNVYNIITDIKYNFNENNYGTSMNDFNINKVNNLKKGKDINNYFNEVSSYTNTSIFYHESSINISNLYQFSNLSDQFNDSLCSTYCQILTYQYKDEINTDSNIQIPIELYSDNYVTSELIYNHLDEGFKLSDGYKSDYNEHEIYLLNYDKDYQHYGEISENSINNYYEYRFNLSEDDYYKYYYKLTKDPEYDFTAYPSCTIIVPNHSESTADELIKDNCENEGYECYDFIVDQNEDLQSLYVFNSNQHYQESNEPIEITIDMFTIMREGPKGLDCDLHISFFNKINYSQYDIVVTQFNMFNLNKKIIFQDSLQSNNIFNAIVTAIVIVVIILIILIYWYLSRDEEFENNEKKDKSNLNTNISNQIDMSGCDSENEAKSNFGVFEDEDEGFCQIIYNVIINCCYSNNGNVD